MGSLLIQYASKNRDTNQKLYQPNPLGVSCNSRIYIAKKKPLITKVIDLLLLCNTNVLINEDEYNSSGPERQKRHR